ncbi:MAG TPA: hypothetical protein VFJ63_01475 [Candidatus Bathyarchaeia archaeon]|nr:hypothetical protein [Candidatus Bathyarchaeia archaeon]
MNLLTFLPVAATLVPRIRNRTRGVMILAALVAGVAATYLFQFLTSPATLNFVFIIFLLLPLASLILVGGILVLLSSQSERLAGEKDSAHR